jgi:hypothetical protein
MRKLIFLFNFIFLTAVFGFVLVLNQAFAWTEPSTTPPTGNVSAPLNVGSSLQSKVGSVGFAGATADSKYGLTVNNGTISSLRTYNKTTLAEVELNRLFQGVYVSANKQSYNGVTSIVNGASSNAAYFINSDLLGNGLYVSSQNVGGLVTGKEMGLYVKSDKVGLSSVLNKSGSNISETKLNYYNTNSKPVGVGVYNYNPGTTTTNSFAELGLEKIGIRAQGDQYAGYFSGNVYINGVLSVTSKCNGCADLAETISTESRVEAGDIVAMNQSLKLRKANKNDKDVVGVISTTPVMTLGSTTEINGAPLALAGIVPVKVTNENGAIRAGDFITASTTAGYGMKAIEPSTVVGKALQDLKGERGIIKIIVSLSWYGGQ